MKILTGTGSTSYDDIQIETSARKLVVKATITQWDELENVRIDVKLNDKITGTKTVLPSMPILHALEIAASNEGFIFVSPNGPGIDVSCSIELSNAGALETKDGYLSVNITGCLAPQIWEVYVTDDAVLVKEYIDYQQVYVNANSQKEINVRGYYQLAVPTTVTELIVNFENGRSCTYMPEELKLITRELNELAIVDTTGIFATPPRVASGTIQPGFKNFYCIGLVGAVSVKVSQSTSQNVYIVKNSELIY